MVLKKGDKIITFSTDTEANAFLGLREFEHEVISVQTGAKLYMMYGPRVWDDGSEMELSDWVLVAKALVLGYDQGDVQIIS